MYQLITKRKIYMQNNTGHHDRSMKKNETKARKQKTKNRYYRRTLYRKDI